MERIFHSHADKTHFPEIGYALGLIESEGFWNSDVAYSKMTPTLTDKIANFTNPSVPQFPDGVE